MREPGLNSSNLVVGLLTTYTEAYPEGMTRVIMLSDPTRGLGNLAEPECRIVNAALALAADMGVPVEWFAVSSGALISMESGTENMDWIALTLRRIIEFTQDGGEINIVVTGINVGGQPYWNAEATMLHAHPRHPDHDPGQLDGAHRQAGPGLLRWRVGRRQLRHRRLRAGDGPQRPGAVLGAVAGRRLRAAAAPLRAHLREARRAVPAADPERPIRRTATSGRSRTRPSPTATSPSSATSSPPRRTRSARSPSTCAR